MPSTNEFAYIPNFCMPIIQAPTEEDNTDYYNNLDVTITPNNEGNDGITFELTGAQKLDYEKLYTVVGGIINYISGGNRLPDGSISPGEGTIVLIANIADVIQLMGDLPLGIAPMSQVFYLNAKSEAFRSAIEIYLNNLEQNSIEEFNKILPETILNNYWSEVNSSDPFTISRDIKQSRYLDGILNGENTIFISGGTYIGKMEINNSTNPQFSLRFLDGTGLMPFSPLVYLRNLPLIAGKKWENHPLIIATESFSTPVDIFVRFEVWNPNNLESTTEAEFIPVDENVIVELWDYDPISFTDNKIITDPTYTNINGVVHFNFESPPPDWLTDYPDLYFKIINPSCSAITEYSLPVEWSTKGSGTKFWRAVDGSPGYYEAFQGNRIGSAIAPIIFRIGLDYHFKLKYLKDFDYFPSPKGIFIEIKNTNLSSTLITMQTDKHGEIHGILFNVSPGDSISLNIIFKIENSNINLPTAYVSIPDWDTYLPGVNQKYFPDNEFTTLGKKNLPEEFIATSNDRNAALFVLKILTEWSTFLNYVTKGEWKGVKDLVIHLNAFGLVSYSVPLGSLFLVSEDHFRRSKIVHELSHQIMWKEIAGTSLDAIYMTILLTISQVRHLSSPGHSINFITDERYAFIEGWAEFIQKIFTGIFFFKNDDLLILETTPFYTGSAFNHLNPPPNGLGEKVEGAFANTMAFIFWNCVMDGINEISTERSGFNYYNSIIKESNEGDIKINNKWMTDKNIDLISSRFKALIFTPFKQLNGFSDVDTTAMMNKILINVSSILKPKVLSEMQRWNLMVNNPQLFGLDNIQGPTSGGQLLQIFCGDVIQNNKENPFNSNVEIQILFGNIQAKDVIVVNNTLITCITPPGTGLVNVKIRHIVRSLNIDSNEQQYLYT